MRRRILGPVAIGLACGLAMAAVPAQADVKAGVDAWSRGDFKRAVEEWRPLAVAGDADAQFNLGQAYKLGRGVPLDPALAESWFRKAALQGHLQAQDNYGLALFQAGKKAEAVPWLEKSVARGEPRTQLVLGTMLFNGDGATRDYPRAYALMTRASAAGLQSAQQTLAQMDQYISPADRERGTALAQQYATQEKVEQDRLAANAPPRPQTVGRPGPDRPPVLIQTDVPPSRTPPAARPQRLPASPGPERIAAPQPLPKPAPKPVAAKPVAAKPAAAPTTGGWRIQLGAFRDQANAETLWSRVRGKLGGAQPTYAKAGGIVRLQAGGYASKAQAAAACKASGTACVVVAP